MNDSEGRRHRGNFAIVFDCDGVLVDSETINNRVFAELATQAGLPTSFDDSVRRYMGRATDECVVEIEQALGRSVGFDFAAVYEDEVLRRQMDLQATPGVRDLLDWLRTINVPTCVASSGTPSEIKHRLEVTGMADYFGPYVYSASMVKHGKPAPDLFILAARGIGVSPASCLVIEDSVYGVSGGKAAGMRVIGFASLASPTALLNAGADLIVRTMGELRDYISSTYRPATEGDVPPFDRAQAGSS